MISFVIFQGDNLSNDFNIIKGLFGLNGELFINNVTLYYLKGYVLFIVSIITPSKSIYKFFMSPPSFYVLYHNNIKRKENYAFLFYFRHFFIKRYNIILFNALIYT